MKKTTLLISLLFVATLFLQNASAMLLPYSSYYQGRSYYDDNGIKATVEFAVYDTEGAYGNEWTEATSFDSPGDGRYIYAYQIFNDADNTDTIEFFTIMGLDGHQLSGINTMNTQNPWENVPLLIDEGVAPTNDFPNTNTMETMATWDFAGGILVADKYSWFLIFSSDNDWTIGRYNMSSSMDDGTGIIPNPEPCTLALLGLGSAVLLAKRRNVIKLHGARS
jgi:hypothetical protein